MIISTETIAKKFKDYTTNHIANKRWVVVNNKTPVKPGTDKPIEWRNPENRYYWEQVTMIPSKDGYGIILDKTGLTCIDFDKCLKDGKITKPEIEKIVGNLSTWTEISSSGNGLHAWILTDANTPNKKDHAAGIEIITDGHVKVTGNSFEPMSTLDIKLIDGSDLVSILTINETKPKKGKRGKLPDTITEGSRNETMFKYASKLRSDGLSEPAIMAALIEENKIRCNPPLPDNEIRAIAQSAGSYPPGKPNEVEPAFKSEEDIEKDRELEQRASDIFLNGKFMDLLKEAYDRIWCGDTHILKWTACSFANGFISTSTDGLDLFITGPSGLGKSDGARKALVLIPESHRKIGQFSKKGFIYAAQNWPEGTICLHDDHIWSDEEAGMLRAIMTGWAGGSFYYTVDNVKSKEVPVPPRITQIITNADGLSESSSGGQNESRFLTSEISRSDDDLKRIFEFIKDESDKIKDIDFKLINKIWEFITSNMHDVKIPYIKHIIIEDSAIKKVREFKKFLSLIRSIALLNGRKVATTSDFEEACVMWKSLLLMIDHEIPGLFKSEMVVLGAIKANLVMGSVELSLLKTKVNMSEASIYRALYGINGNFSAPTGGLLTKVRGLTVEKFYNKDTGKSDRMLHYVDTTIVSGEFYNPYRLDANANESRENFVRITPTSGDEIP